LSPGLFHIRNDAPKETTVTHHGKIATANPTAVVSREDLKAALDKTKHVIETGTNIPIIETVMLSADDGALVVTATDLDITMAVAVPGDVDTRMFTALPAKLLHASASKTKADHVAIEMLPGEPEMIPILDAAGTHRRNDEGHFMYEPREYKGFISRSSTVTYGKTEFTIESRAAEDFPELPDFAGKTSAMTMAASTLWDAIDSVKAAVSTEETRYYLNGIYFYLHDAETIRAVATDGHRLYCQDIAAPKGCKGMPAVIIPRKMTTILYKLLHGKGAPAAVAIEVSERYFQVSWEGVTIRSKTIDGTYPDYARIIPSENGNRIVIDAEDLVEAVTAVTVISSERGRAVKAEFDEKECCLSMNNPTSGSAKTTIPCTSKFDPIVIGFNSGYLLDVVARACPAGGDIVIEAATGEEPVTITGDQHGWRAVLMPMRV
jgi:DNA polymerase-3 subunit beta